MKLITLIPFKNESAFIKTAIESVKQFSDEVICIDDNSSDNSPLIAKNLGAKVYLNNDLVNYGWSELNIRKNLLKLGREHGGTHFLCLDADEAITSNLQKHISIIENLKPKNRICLQWLAMWKSATNYKNDHSVWSNNFKDFIFCDDGKIDFPDIWMHTPRTPGTDWQTITLPLEVGAVMHFQFVDWNAFQIKQCWYRCSELIKNGGNNSSSINEKYSITLDDKNSKLDKLNESYYSGFALPNCKEVYQQTLWRLDQIKNWFKLYGLDFFSKLDIWHVKEINELKYE